METPSDSVCRLCLAVEADNKMLSLTRVQELYEKVTSNRIYTNKMPVTACYICYAQLKRCYKFMVKSTEAENTLVEILKTQTEITPKSVCKINREDKGLATPLTVTPVKHENFPLNFDVPTLVKIEPIKQEEIEIKVEVVEDITVSAANDCGGDSEEGNVTSQCIQDEGPGPAKKHEPHHGVIVTSTNKYLKIRPGKSHECTVCKKRFTRNAQLAIHLRTHTGEKPFVCEFCDSKFTQPSALHRHLKAHRGEKPHECNICERKFIALAELRIHLRTHTGEKPYTCDVCNKSFSIKKHLTSHMRSHTGEKPYKCEVCDNRFKEGSHLKRHMSMHTGEKPFECDICGLRFGRKWTLKTHLMIHSDEKPYCCNICDHSFNRPTHLKLHLLTHERQNTSSKYSVLVS